MCVTAGNGQIVGLCYRRDPDVIRFDGTTCSAKLGENASESLGDTGVNWQDFRRLAYGRLVKPPQFLFTSPLSKSLYARKQLCLCDDRHEQFGICGQPLQPGKNGWMSALDLAPMIGVQQLIHGAPLQRFGSMRRHSSAASRIESASSSVNVPASRNTAAGEPRGGSSFGTTSTRTIVPFGSSAPLSRTTTPFWTVPRYTM